MPLPKAITIMGPTASGKTDLAIGLCEKLNGEIISVDSALIYKGMDIGTAKPSAEELAVAPHRLINILDPSESYNVADFCRDARLHIDEILAAGKTPILVGGTMMYFKSLLEGLSTMPATDNAIRNEIEAKANQQGWQAIHDQLAQVDPVSAEAIHPNHTHRVSRALEVYLSSGKTMSYWQAQPKNGLLDQFDWVQIALAPRDRSILHRRIERRFDLMLNNGFMDEVKGLYTRGDLHADLASIRSVGYRQAWEYLDNGEQDYALMRDKGCAATRQLAKRQLTWLRGWQNAQWVYTDNDNGQSLSQLDVLNRALNICNLK